MLWRIFHKWPIFFLLRCFICFKNSKHTYLVYCLFACFKTKWRPLLFASEIYSFGSEQIFSILFLFYEIFSFVLVLEFCLCFASTNVRICLLLILLLWLLENWRKHNHIFPRLTILISAGRNSRCLLYWIANFFRYKNNSCVLLKNSLVYCLLMIWAVAFHGINIFACFSNKNWQVACVSLHFFI